MRRWALAGVAVLAGGIALTVASLPYVPLVHGTTAGEVERLAAWLGVEPGMHVADVGAGDGTFAMKLAQRVGPSGHVYATEIDGSRLATLRQRARAAGLSNVTVVEGAVSQTNLPDACCDAVFSRNVYHHLADPTAINADIRRALRPGGRLLVIDFEPGGLMDWIGRSHGTDRDEGHGTRRETLVAEVTASGFELTRGPERWRGRMYGVLFTRTVPGSGAAARGAGGQSVSER